MDAEISSWKQLFSCFTNNLNSKDSPDLVQWWMNTMLGISLRDQNWRDDFSQNHWCEFSLLINFSPLWLINLWSFGGSGSTSFFLGGSDHSSVIEKKYCRPHRHTKACISSLPYWLHVKLFLLVWLRFGFSCLNWQQLKKVSRWWTPVFTSFCFPSRHGAQRFPFDPGLAEDLIHWALCSVIPLKSAESQPRADPASQLLSPPIPGTLPRPLRN